MLGEMVFADNTFLLPKQSMIKNDVFQVSCENISQQGKLTIAIEGYITFLLDENRRPQESNSEIVNRYYQKFGNDFHEKLDGLFIILIFDSTTNQLKIFNNRYQATNLYYYRSTERLLFSRNLKEITQYLNKDLKLNKESVLSFISNGFTITDQTQYQNINKLLPAFRIIADRAGAQLETHWNKEFNFNRKPFENLEDHLDLYENIYREGLENYIQQAHSQEIGTLMSGGHDTSFVLIESSQVFDKPIHTFTTTFPNWNFDEGPYAKNITEKFNGIYHGIPFVPEDLDYIVSLIRANDEPVVGSSLPLHICSREAAKYVDTMFAGDGGDTLWGEYYPVGEYHRFIKNLPLSIRRSFHSLSKTMRDIFDWERLWELEHVAGLFTEEDYYKGFMRKLCTYRHFSDHEQSLLFSNDFLEGLTPAESIYEVPFTRDNFKDALIEGKLFNAFYTYQSFHTTKSMEHFGLNFYLPTINKKVIDFITSLPENYINGGTAFHRLTNNKKINRRFHKLALARYLDRNEIYNRSFDIPWYNILKPRPAMLEKLLKRLKARGWYQESYLNKIFKEFTSQQVKDHELLELKHHGYRIFTLLSQEIWATEYLDNKFTKNPDEKIVLEDYLT